MAEPYLAYEDMETELMSLPQSETERRKFLQSEIDKAQEKLNAISRPGLDRIVDHIAHAADLVGIEHVGLGSDFDGIAVCPDGMEDVSRFGALAGCMRKRGFSEKDIAAVYGGNLYRILRNVLQYDPCR